MVFETLPFQLPSTFHKDDKACAGGSPAPIFLRHPHFFPSNLYKQQVYTNVTRLACFEALVPSSLSWHVAKSRSVNGVDSSFKIQGQRWSKKEREDYHQVFWTISDVVDAGSCLPDELNLAAVVEYHGPFQGIVEVNAKTTFPGSRYLEGQQRTLYSSTE